jgi:hypothetical protein
MHNEELYWSGNCIRLIEKRGGGARLVQAEALQQSEAEEMDARAPPKSTI